LLTAYRRASNIVGIEERKDGPHEGPIDKDLLKEDEERALEEHLSIAQVFIAEQLRNEDFQKAMVALIVLRRPVDEFFEHVTVNTDDTKLRENRLRLLARIRATMNQVADFSQIEG
jgi:glycyl-tRNA synthetase beta chain